jgi:hypothetical protein
MLDIVETGGCTPDLSASADLVPRQRSARKTAERMTQ